MPSSFSHSVLPGSWCPRPRWPGRRKKDRSDSVFLDHGQVKAAVPAGAAVCIGVGQEKEVPAKRIGSLVEDGECQVVVGVGDEIIADLRERHRFIGGEGHTGVESLQEVPVFPIKAGDREPESPAQGMQEGQRELVRERSFQVGIDEGKTRPSLRMIAPASPSWNWSPCSSHSSCRPCPRVSRIPQAMRWRGREE